MDRNSITINPIGVIHTPFTDPSGTPIQPGAGRSERGLVEVLPEYSKGLKDLDGFDRIWLLFWFHRSHEPKLTVVPSRDTVPRGLFATRAPSRPNPIGISAVKLISISGCTLTVDDVDMIDGTPLLDIKPYVPKIDSCDCLRIGWLGESRNPGNEADNRFERD